MQDYTGIMEKMERRDILVNISGKCKDIKILESMNMKDEVKELLVKERKEKRKILDKCCYNLDVQRKKRIKNGSSDGDGLEKKAVQWREFLVS